MNLTAAQLSTLKGDIAANTNTILVAGTPVQIKDVAARADKNDLAPDVGKWYDQQASGPYVVWRGPLTPITPAEYMGASGIVWTAVDALTAGKARIFEWLTRGLTGGLNPSDSNVRTGISDCFGGGTQSTTNLVALAKRNATNGEKLFASGSGISGSPSTMAGAANGTGPGLAEGSVTGQNVIDAWAAA